MVVAREAELSDLSRVDRRLRAWRQREARREELVAALGGEDSLSPYQRGLVGLSLGLSALVTDFEARLCAGEQVDTERYLAAIKEHRKILVELKLPLTNKPAASLRDHVAKRVAARADGGAER